MAMQIVTTVDKKAVSNLKVSLYGLMNIAKSVTAENTFVKVREAQEALRKAEGMYEALSKLDLLDELSITPEDIDRIDGKINTILEEKRRKQLPKWKSEV